MDLIRIPKGCDPTLKLPDPTLLDYYRDDEARTIWLLDEVSNQCYDFISSIIRYNKEDENIPVEERQPIKIIIDNCGGSLEIARSFCSIIELSKTPIYTIGIGTVASAASLIYVCGHKRFATKNTVFVLHNGGASDIQGTFDQLMAMFQNYQREIEEMHEVYAKYTNYSEDELETRLTQDWYITIDDAIEHKLADEVIESIETFYK